MEILVWTQDWSVGDAELDGDHQRMVEIINRVSAFEKYDVDIARLLDELRDYARQHFAQEEKLMAATGFAGLAAHREEHQEFVNWLAAVQMTFSHSQESRSMILGHVNEYLQAWFRNHILETDKQYAGHI